MSTQSQFRERTKIKIEEPKHYKVIMHNDDFTTMEFVVEILIDVFHKGEAEAQMLMMTVHKGGKAVVGIYPRDIAATKIKESMRRAKEQGYPFRLTMEEN